MRKCIASQGAYGGGVSDELRPEKVFYSVYLANVIEQRKPFRVSVGDQMSSVPNTDLRWPPMEDAVVGGVPGPRICSRICNGAGFSV